MNQSEALLKLQEIDLELMRRHAALEKVQAHAKLDQFARARKKLNANLTKVVGLRKDFEIELQDNRDKKAHLEDIVAEVQQKFETTSDYKMVREFEGQLSILAKKIEKLEFEARSLEKELAKAQKAEKNAHLIAQKLDDEQKLTEERVAQGSSDINASIAELEQKRSEMRALLSDELLKTYDADLKKYRGLAVETLNGNKPSICRVALQPSQYSDIRHADTDIVTCPYCRRLLVATNAQK